MNCLTAAHRAQPHERWSNTSSRQEPFSGVPKMYFSDNSMALIVLGRAQYSTYSQIEYIIFVQSLLLCTSKILALFAYCVRFRAAGVVWMDIRAVEWLSFGLFLFTFDFSLPNPTSQKPVARRWIAGLLYHELHILRLNAMRKFGNSKAMSSLKSEAANYRTSCH